MTPIPIEDLERILKGLGNANRLKLLVALQEPKGYVDIELTPSRDDSWGSQTRSISRQAVQGHIATLRELGIVKEVSVDEDREAKFLVDRPRLFRVVEELRQLATVQPTEDPGGETVDLDQAPAAPDIAGPHLVLVRGVEEGRAFRLGKDEGGSWVIGRSREADVPLDYDPYVSSEHAVLMRREGGTFVQDLPENKNGTFLNWKRMVEGGIAPLKSGDIIQVGMSLLVYRE